MPSFRHRRAGIKLEAQQFTKSNAAAILKWINGVYAGQTVAPRLTDNEIAAMSHDELIAATALKPMELATRKGATLRIPRRISDPGKAEVGDWIVRSPSNEFYAVKPAEFEADMELVAP